MFHFQLPISLDIYQLQDDKTAPVQTALVSHVEPGTAAARAGMQAGERILVVDGVAVTRLSYVEIVRLIAER